MKILVVKNAEESGAALVQNPVGGCQEASGALGDVVGAGRNTFNHPLRVYTTFTLSRPSFGCTIKNVLLVDLL